MGLQSNPKTLEQSPLHFHSCLTRDRRKQPFWGFGQSIQGQPRGHWLSHCGTAEGSLPYILSGLLFMWPKQDNADERQKKTGLGCAQGSAPLNLYSLLHGALKPSLWEEGNLLQGKQALWTVLVGPYSNSPGHYLAILLTKITQGKLLAHVAAGAKEQVVLKSFLNISRQEPGRSEKHHDAGNVTLVTG